VSSTTKFCANIRAIGKAFERAPATYSAKGEEELRDHLLAILNTNFEGAVHAESFNVSGKTDLLIRVSDIPLFVSECKWWSGPSAMNDAVDQLLGYTTWRDSRLALVIFVPNIGFHDVIESGRDVLAERSEFASWLPLDHAGELRCAIRWPDDPGREGVLTTMFFHLPRKASGDAAVYPNRRTARRTSPKCCGAVFRAKGPRSAPRSARAVASIRRVRPT
jgi:hypothetical protein